MGIKIRIRPLMTGSWLTSFVAPIFVLRGRGTLSRGSPRKEDLAVGGWGGP